jgi:hypothetical protein
MFAAPLMTKHQSRGEKPLLILGAKKEKLIWLLSQKCVLAGY